MRFPVGLGGLFNVLKRVLLLHGLTIFAGWMILKLYLEGLHFGQSFDGLPCSSASPLDTRDLVSHYLLLIAKHASAKYWNIVLQIFERRSQIST